MDIRKLIEQKINKSAYFNEGFLVIFDTYIPYFKEKKLYDVVTLEPLLSWRNEGDLLSILNEKNIPYEYLPIVLRFNEIYNNGDVTDEQTSLLIPNATEINRIYNVYRTVIRK